MFPLTKVPIRITVREFLIWDPGDGLRYELADGEPRVMAIAPTIHGFLKAELAAMISNHLLERSSDCRVLVNPAVRPRLLAAHNLRIADLGVTCSPLLPAQLTIPDPVLLMEILSANHQAETWSNTWTYTTISSVQEILVLHADRIAAELLRRTSEGIWPEEPQEISDGTLELTSIGFTVALQALYEGTGLTA